MIYFLNNDLELQKIVTSENINRAQHEDEKNNLKMMTLEMDLAYAKSFLNDDIDHFGYYVKDAFHVAKIRRVEESHDGEILTVIGHHIFFSDMNYGRLVEDVRPVDRDAAFILRNTIGANTRWHPVITDTTGVLSTNFYWTTPMEVVEFVTENFRLEFEPEILFDGQKVNGLNIHFKKRLGEDKPKRVVFGPNTPTLEYDIDYSEIVTKLAVHGKGEEVGDGYGRRINFSDRNINRDGIISPLGSRYLEDPDITASYGNFDNEPKHANVIFEDIENVNELIEAGIQEYERLSRPQYIFTATVADIGNVNIGDSVLIVRREHGIYFRARVHKISVDLLNPQDAEVVLGDYEHFKETKVERSARRQRESNERAVNSRITELKNAFDARFDGEVAQMWEDYEQALIDAHAEIDAAEQRMENLIETERDTMMDDYNEKVEGARQHAEQQAQEKADSVQSNLEAVTSSHQGLLDDLFNDVSTIDDWRFDVDDFLGDVSSITLDERLQDINLDFEERIRNINLNTRNMLRGTAFDEPEQIHLHGDSYIRDNNGEETVRMGPATGFNTTSIRFLNAVKLEANTDYYFILEHRTLAVRELDYLQLQLDDGSYQPIFDADTGLEGFTNLNFGTLDWHKNIIRINSPVELEGQLRLGTRFDEGNTTRGWIDIRQPYLTNTSNRDWLPHVRDANQSIEEVTRRITELEDGRHELITRTEYDFETEQITQTVKDIEETVDTSRQMIVDINDYDVIKNGSEVMQTVLGFEQKVWLNDVADIGANLIPQSANAWEDGSYWSGNGADNPTNTRIRLKRDNVAKVVKGEMYTFSDFSNYWSRVSRINIFQYEDGIYTGSGGWKVLNRGGSTTFTAEGNEVLFSIEPPGAPDWTNINTSQMEHLEYPVQIKLEKGDTATPMMNALSRVEQLADRFSVQVLELDGEYVKQSSFEINPDYWQLGSVRIGGEEVGTILRGSPDAIEMVARELNITADMNVAGDIEALAVDAIKGEFASLWAAEFEAITITGDHIDSNTIRAEHIFVQNAMIEDIINTHLFTDTINTMTINAIYADLRKVDSEIMSANIIKSNWLDVDTALIERVYLSDAFIDNAEIKAANIRDLDAITINANQITLTTLRNRVNQIEGGLNIVRSDGVSWVENGNRKGDSPVQIHDFYNPNSVSFTGQNYLTTNSHWQRFKFFYTPHQGTRLRVVWAVSMNGPHSSDYIEVRVTGFGGYNPINMGYGSSSRRSIVHRDGATVYITHDISLPPPNYQIFQGYLEFRRDPEGTGAEQGVGNGMLARVLHIGQYD